MLIPLGFWAASAGGVGPTPFAAFDLLETQVLGSTTSSVTFSSLGTYAADYKHLQLRTVVRTDRGSTEDFYILNFNGSSSNYAWHALNGYGSSVASENQTSQATIRLPNAQSATGPTNAFSPVVIDILDPFSTSKNTTLKAFGGNSASVWFTSGGWFDTSSITSIALDQGLGSNFLTGSRFSLYGIKAA